MHSIFSLLSICRVWDTFKTDIKEALNLFQEFVFQRQIIFEIDYTGYISHLYFPFPRKIIFGIFSENSFLSFVIEYQHCINIFRQFLETIYIIFVFQQFIYFHGIILKTHHKFRITIYSYTDMDRAANKIIFLPSKSAS